MTDIYSFISSAVLFVLLCILPFLVYIVVMASLHQKIGNWYVGKVESLDKKELSTFTFRNMMYPGIAFLVLFLLGIAYVIFRPPFVDPSWLGILLLVAIAFVVLFQAIQFVWLYFRVKKKK